jgi:hypothetical protein
MKEQFPMLYWRCTVGPRVHRVFSTMGLVLALVLVLALLAGGEGEIGGRFARALGKGSILVAFAAAYFGWALTRRATKDPVWAALVEKRIVRVYPFQASVDPCVGVETSGAEKLSVSCQNKEQQQKILDEFRATGSVQVTAQ